MAKPLGDVVAMATDAAFQDKCIAALVIAARGTLALGDGAPPPLRALAPAILRDPASWRPMLPWAVASDDAVVRNGRDEDLQAAVGRLMPLLARLGTVTPI